MGGYTVVDVLRIGEGGNVGAELLDGRSMAVKNRLNCRHVRQKYSFQFVPLEIGLKT